MSLLHDLAADRILSGLSADLPGLVSRGWAPAGWEVIQVACDDAGATVLLVRPDPNDYTNPDTPEINLRVEWSEPTATVLLSSVMHLRDAAAEHGSGAAVLVSGDLDGLYTMIAGVAR